MQPPEANQIPHAACGCPAQTLASTVCGRQGRCPSALDPRRVGHAQHLQMLAGQCDTPRSISHHARPITAGLLPNGAVQSSTAACCGLLEQLLLQLLDLLVQGIFWRLALRRLAAWSW